MSGSQDFGSEPLLLIRDRIVPRNPLYIQSTNTLWKYVRSGLYTAAEVRVDLVDLQALPLIVVSKSELMLEAFNISLNYRISAYDTSYVALSQEVNAPLLTLDNKLVKALATPPFNVLCFANFSLPSV